ncbi:hypothetical protein HanIR_Chr14g0722481 [Helianthus annuus]|nr:hypothetical protein HanIR_Chr14g0722481 [Helianthus annuus]
MSPCPRHTRKFFVGFDTKSTNAQPLLVKSLTTSPLRPLVFHDQLDDVAWGCETVTHNLIKGVEHKHKMIAC